MIRTRGLALVVVALAVLVAGMPGDAAAKKKKAKGILAVTVNGKKLKPTPRTVQFSGGGGTIGFSVSGQKIPGGGRGIIKTLYMACATLWPPPALGQPLLACTGSYSETNTRNPTAAKYWMNILVDDSVQIIVDSWDGTVVKGRINATIQPGPQSPGLPPVVVVGTFSGPVAAGNPNR